MYADLALEDTALKDLIEGAADVTSTDNSSRYV
jgi:hypothetical protein